MYIYIIPTTLIIAILAVLALIAVARLRADRVTVEVLSECPGTVACRTTMCKGSSRPWSFEFLHICIYIYIYIYIYVCTYT